MFLLQSFNTESGKAEGCEAIKQDGPRVSRQMILLSSMTALGDNLEWSLYVYSMNSCLQFCLCSVTTGLKFTVWSLAARSFGCCLCCLAPGGQVTGHIYWQNCTMISLESFKMVFQYFKLCLSQMESKGWFVCFWSFFFWPGLNTMSNIWLFSFLIAANQQG